MVGTNLFVVFRSGYLLRSCARASYVCDREGNAASDGVGSAWRETTLFSKTSSCDQLCYSIKENDF